jgi:hypothetical protein
MSPHSPADRTPATHYLDQLLNVAPGLLLGSYLGGLIFFLNPGLAFGAGAFLRGSLLYGGTLGLLTFLALAPFTWRRPGLARRIFPWSLTAILSVAAIVFWIQAWYYVDFVPPGMNARLIKAAAWLTLCALVTFYTALLHSLQNRTYSKRTAAFLAILAVISVYVLIERREAFKPLEEAALPSAVAEEVRPLLMVVGLEGATLDAILPLAEQGQLPFFSQLMQEGAWGRLATLSPNYESALWTSLATGKMPYNHGVLGEDVFPAGFLSPGHELKLLPAGFGGLALKAAGIDSHPPDATTKSVLGGWEVLVRLGLSVGVVGWPACYPSESDVDFAFSERYFDGEYLAASARPNELVERGIFFRLSTADIDPGVVGQLGIEVPHDLLRVLAGDLWRESLTTFLMDQGRNARAWFLMLPGLSEVSARYFGSYSAVQFEGDQKPLHHQSAQFVISYYRHLDAFLAELWQRTSGPRILAVVSAFGVNPPNSGERFLDNLSGRPLKGDFGDAPDGVIFLAGEGIQAGVFLEDAQLVDVMPTLLYGMRFPVARDLDGRVLVSAFEPSFLARTPLTFVPSYETLATDVATPAAR